MASTTSMSNTVKISGKFLEIVVTNQHAILDSSCHGSSGSVAHYRRRNSAGEKHAEAVLLCVVPTLTLQLTLEHDDV